MWPSSHPGRRDIFAVFLRIFLIILVLMLLAEQCSGENNTTTANSSENDSSLSQLVPGETVYDTHVYITNNDNERLKVSLFIDDELKDSKELSADSETKIDTYPISKGPHRFKITWWDEDVKKSFEVDEEKNIVGETSVNLYTSLHDALEKFDISVKLTNENDNSLEAFLYVDGSFEKSKEVSKDSTTDLGTIKLEEGPHNLSVKWQDTDTRIEYEKTRKITVSKEDVVVFYAPKGVSFEAKMSAVPSEKPGYSSTKSSETKDAYPKTKTTEIDNPESTNSSKNLTIGASTSSIAKDETRSVSLSETGAQERKPLKSPSSALDDSDRIYLYALLVMVAVYLILRH
ncbi:MAG: hypothetical protein LUQ59_04445 [Methanothrix sp.]|nr:hypothetical protein [Methanothrix sp.]